MNARFSPMGTLAVATLEQVAVYNKNGELEALLELPPTEGSWNLTWLTAGQLAITDDKHVYSWDYQQAKLAGPWVSSQRMRLIDAHQHQLALAFDAPVLEWLHFNDAGHPIHRTTIEVAGRISQLHFDNDGGLLVADESGRLSYLQGADRDPLWTIQFANMHVVQSIASSPEQVVVVTQPPGDRFATGSGQQIVQIDRNSGKINHRADPAVDGQVASLMTEGQRLWLGSSGNCMYLHRLQRTTSAHCYPRPQRLGRQTGQVIALHVTDTKVYGVTSAGYLQVWQKKDIVSPL
ncbi:hypothetical protein CWE12_12335 [Aliidiomarina sedimenti]|uniref:WD40 repeat domain-containing protein n=1 Tax=Aliidiomarina sedimenti TaxID=1933879 RepID=A0ABY0BUR3_9GAMM|nr:hypothetical protein [Aliidiomarina sedimenti]RUO28013.1 hypothetical protein CWE12_12335 [Aliidiomarina sedimenti]